MLAWQLFIYVLLQRSGKGQLPKRTLELFIFVVRQLLLKVSFILHCGGGGRFIIIVQGKPFCFLESLFLKIPKAWLVQMQKPYDRQIMTKKITCILFLLCINSCLGPFFWQYLLKRHLPREASQSFCLEVIKFLNLRREV